MTQNNKQSHVTLNAEAYATYQDLKAKLESEVGFKLNNSQVITFLALKVRSCPN